MNCEDIEYLLADLVEDFDDSEDFEIVRLGPQTRRAIRETLRLIEWIKRIARDTAGGNKAGYHAIRIRLEASKVLRGQDVP